MRSRKKTGRLWIGTSGLVLRGTKREFPDEFKEQSRLAYYSTLFNSIEINSTFYKLHKAATFERWSNEVRDDFRFTIKLWKEVTHKKSLEYDEGQLRLFFSTLEKIQSKRGCLLIQFPASIKSDYLNKVTRLLQSANKLNNNQWHLCIEFRDSSWYSEQVFTMLREANASLVYHDMPKSAPPLGIMASGVLYLRFHGPAGDYRGSYPETVLEQYADIISKTRQEGKDVYVYFNNTIGEAFENARWIYERGLGDAGR